MSGHSKWKQIKYKKGAADAKKGAIFTHLSKVITLAAREGGDPAMNFKLATAVEQARGLNMPKDNIERAIRRGTGEEVGLELHETTYEAYGPAGAALIIKVVTDNINRAVADLRHVLAKHGGTLGKSGSVMWNFECKNGIYAPKSTVPLDGEAKKNFAAFIGALDELEDVQDYYTNAV